jgi:predicted nucleic acid-binding protein
MHLFIDTNIYLDFFHFSGPDIEELHKLTALLEDGQIVLHTPRQLCEELKRNRDTKIKDALSQFQSARFKIAFPAFCKIYPEFSELQELLVRINDRHAALYRKSAQDAGEEALNADKVISELFAKSQIAETSAAIYNSAVRRFRMGNPPGKKKVTIGDEVNWEALLATVPGEADLHFVSGDGDYSAAIDPDKFNPFLAAEWKQNKEASVIFYRTLQDFFKVKFPHIRLATDVKKSSLIEKLARSGSFATTHLVIENLNNIGDFSDAQVEQLIEIAELNNQVGWIVTDSDVSAFYRRLLERHESTISQEKREVLRNLLGASTSGDDPDEAPF